MLMRLIRRVLTAILLMLAFGVTGSRGEVRQFKTLTGRDGLSDILVNTIYKDYQGYIWLGTESAIDRYDGNSIVPYPLTDKSKGLGRVNAILHTKQGDLYIGTTSGLSVMQAGTVQPKRMQADRISMPVNALAHDRSGNIYIATDQGLFKYNTRQKQLDKISTEADLRRPDTKFMDVLVQDDRILWAATTHTLYRYVIDTQQIRSFPMPGGGECTHIAMAGNRIYIGMRNVGLVPFDIESQRMGVPVQTGNNLITDIAVDGNKDLWISTDGEGVFRYSPATGRVEERLSTSEGSVRLKSNSVYSVMVDNLGLLWVGYYQMGLDYTPNSHNYFNTYTYPAAGFDSNRYAVRAIAFDGSTKIIGTRDGLFVVDDTRGRFRHHAYPQLRSNIIFCIVPVGNHRYLMGTYNGGMYRLDSQTGDISDFDSNGAIPGNASVFNIAQDDHGDIWAGTSEGLVRFHEDGHADVWTSRNSRLPAGNVYEIFFDSAGRGWICTENGMALWNGESLDTEMFPKDFIHKQKIRDIYEDSSHQLYFVPDRGSVYRSDLQMSKYGPVEFGADENVNTMFVIEDRDRWLWLGTDKGLIRYDRKENFHHFNNADGLPNQVFTLCAPIRDAAGNLWMGNSSGLIELDFNRFKKTAIDHHRPVTITDLKSRGKSIITRMRDDNDNLSISLTGKEDDLVIYLSDFSYKPSEYFVTEYMLEGTDGKWHRAEGSEPIHLYELPSGKYTLKMRVQDNAHTQTVLTIRKSSNISWAMIFIIVALTGGLCYTLYILYRKFYRHSKDAEEYIDAEDATNEIPAVREPEHISYKTTRLSDEECKRLLKLLTNVMNKEKPYTNPNLKSSDLAALIGTKSHSLSFLFNQYMKKTFYDYVNEYRVEEFKRLVNETDISRYTLTALSEKCGFSSRASFFRHFKAFTGITPSEYIKNKLH